MGGGGGWGRRALPCRLLCAPQAAPPLPPPPPPPLPTVPHTRPPTVVPARRCFAIGLSPRRPPRSTSGKSTSVTTGLCTRAATSLAPPCAPPPRASTAPPLPKSVARLTRAPRGRISLMIEEEVERVAEARARSAEVDARDAASAPPPEVATRDDGPIL